MKAIVAVTAIFLPVFFPEIAHEGLSATHTAFGKCDGLINQLSHHFSFTEGLVLHQVLQFVHVFMGIIEYAFSFKTIPPGPSSFLVVIFYGFRNIVMYDKADIRLVDSHSKCDGCNDDLNILVEKHILPV